MVKNRLNAGDKRLLASRLQSMRDLECRLHGVYCNEEVSDLKR